MSNLLEVVRLSVIVSMIAVAPPWGCSKASEAPREPTEEPSVIDQHDDNGLKSMGESRRQVYLDSVFATCADIVGLVEAQRAESSSWRKVDTGCDLRDNEGVRTGPGSRARLRFGRKGSIELGEGSQVILRMRKTPALSMIGGTVNAVLGDKRRAVKRLVVVEGDDQATIALRDGASPAAFRLARSGESSVVLVDDGDAQVTLAGVEIGVPAGRALMLSGASAGQPFDLIAAPALVSPTHETSVECGGADSPVALRWDPVEGAAGYKVALATDESFLEARDVASTEEPAYEVAVSFPDSRFWRVAAIDARGLEGATSVGKFTCRQPPQVEAKAKPADATRYVAIAGKSPKIVFSWGKLDRDVQYRFVIGKGPDPLSVPVADKTTVDGYASVSGLRPGRYRWSVYLGDAGTVSLLGAPRSIFVVKPSTPKVDTRGLWR